MTAFRVKPVSKDEFCSIKDIVVVIDKDFYFDNQFPISEVSKWDYIKDQIKYGYYPVGHEFVGCQMEDTVWFKERLKFFWKSDVEQLRELLISDIKNLFIQSTVNYDLSFKGIEYVVNKRFGYEKEE